MRLLTSLLCLITLSWCVIAFSDEIRYDYKDQLVMPWQGDQAYAAYPYVASRDSRTPSHIHYLTMDYVNYQRRWNLSTIDHHDWHQAEIINTIQICNGAAGGALSQYCVTMSGMIHTPQSVIVYGSRLIIELDPSTGNWLHVCELDYQINNPYAPDLSLNPQALFAYNPIMNQFALLRPDNKYDSPVWNLTLWSFDDCSRITSGQPAQGMRGIVYHQQIDQYVALFSYARRLDYYFANNLTRSRSVFLSQRIDDIHDFTIDPNGVLVFTTRSGACWYYSALDYLNCMPAIVQNAPHMNHTMSVAFDGSLLMLSSELTSNWQSALIRYVPVDTPFSPSSSSSSSTWDSSIDTSSLSSTGVSPSSHPEASSTVSSSSIFSYSSSSVPFNHDTSSNSLSAGSVAAIVFGLLFGVAVFVIVVIIASQRKSKRDNLLAAQEMT